MTDLSRTEETAPPDMEFETTSEERAEWLRQANERDDVEYIFEDDPENVARLLRDFDKLLSRAPADGWATVGPELLKAAEFIVNNTIFLDEESGEHTKVVAWTSAQMNDRRGKIWPAWMRLRDTVRAGYALTKAESLVRPAPKGTPRIGNDEAAFDAYVRNGIEADALARSSGGFMAPKALINAVNRRLAALGNPSVTNRLSREYYAMPAFAADDLDNPSFDILTAMADEIVPAFRSQGASAIETLTALRDPYAAKPCVLVYCTSPVNPARPAPKGEDGK